MSYVRIGGGGGIDPAEYLASLPGYFGVSNCTCHGAGCTWQQTGGGNAGVGWQILLCAGKVVVTQDSGDDGAFAVWHKSSGVTESSIYGTKTIDFEEGDKFSAGGKGFSVTLTWSEV